MSIFTPNKKIKMSETSEISPEQTALDIKALNLFSRQNAALGNFFCSLYYFSFIVKLRIFHRC